MYAESTLLHDVLPKPAPGLEQQISGRDVRFEDSLERVACVSSDGIIDVKPVPVLFPVGSRLARRTLVVLLQHIEHRQRLSRGPSR